MQLFFHGRTNPEIPHKLQQHGARTTRDFNNATHETHRNTEQHTQLAHFYLLSRVTFSKEALLTMSVLEPSQTDRSTR